MTTRLSTRTLATPLTALAAILSLPVTPVRADEGMWPTYALDALPFADLAARGLALGPRQIYDPADGGIADAVVQVGATGSFVSAEGLILTNHHVASGAIQQQSTIDENYLKDGFYAATKVDEIEAPGYRVAVTVDIEDVTQRVLAVVGDKRSGIARYEAIDRAIKEIVAETEKDSHLRCRVAEFYEGAQYVKYATFEIRDVRIVYVPPVAIGNFGGDIDNWIWPRHTGDFAFLRAYVAPDGSPAEFSQENVPYRPRVFLPISLDGVAAGDLTMTIGFPGRTRRYISSFELREMIDFSLPNSIDNAVKQLAIIEDLSREDSEIALRMTNDVNGINNRLKKNRGVLEGLTRSQALAHKLAEEKGLMTFIERDRALRKRYGTVLQDLESLHREESRTRMLDDRLNRAAWTCDYLRLASSLYRWAVESEKPDVKRDRGYQDRDRQHARRRLETAQTNLVPVVDQALLRFTLQALLDLPDGQKVRAIEDLFAGTAGVDRDRAIAAYVERLYAGTRVGDLDARLAMFAMDRGELEALQDPFIELAAGLHPEMERMRERERAFEGTRNRLGPMLVHAYATYRGGSMYPDANGTMRVSFGEVRGYSPRDGVVYEAHTLLSGVFEKETGEDPFIVPAALASAYRRNDPGRYALREGGNIPVDFLTTNDITGGNSGSPVINGRGEIVGLAFDGNYEAVASDYLYDDARNRTIAVDVRYILYLIEKVYGLDPLFDELTIR